jgi:CDP-glycerol glycerophosphotransferase
MKIKRLAFGTLRRILPVQKKANRQTHSKVVPNVDVIDISVVIPVYRSAPYIEQAIRSVADHTACQFEIIAVDDESPDNSVEIITALQRDIPQLRLLSHPNMGGARTLNRGLSEARGRYVMFLDGDDWVKPHALDILLERAERDGSEIAMGVLERWSEGRLSDVFDTRPIVTSQILTGEEKSTARIIYENSFYTGAIFRRDFLNSQDIWFPDLLYADRPFAVTARVLANQVSITPLTVAIWRKREDPENLSITDQTYNPAIFQAKVVSYLETYDRLVQRDCTSEARELLRHIIPRLFWNLDKLISHDYTTAIARSVQVFVWAISAIKDDVTLGLRQRLILDQVGFYDPEYAHAYIKQLDRIIAEGRDKPNSALSQDMIALKHVGLPRTPMTAVDFPKDPEMVLFDTNFGRSYGGVPKYIYRMLNMSGYAFKAVWVYGHGQKMPSHPVGAIFVEYKSPEYYAALSRAKYWVTNIKIASPYKPKGTILLQTWHGTPLKKLGLDIEMSGPEVDARADLLEQAKNWDYLISPNAYSSEIFRRAFDFQGKVLETGYPSNAPLVPTRLAKSTADARARFGVPEGRKVVLYAPTWRDNQRIGNSWNFRFRLQLDLHRLQARLGETHYFLIRLHHLSRKALPDDAFEAFNGFAHNVSAAPDTTELMAAADILITDYSSIFFDFAVTRRPMIFYMYDRDSYVEGMRDFYLNPDDVLPGPIVEDENSLIAALQAENFADFSTRYERFSAQFNSLDDGYAGRRVINEVFTDLRRLPEDKHGRQRQRPVGKRI